MLTQGIEIADAVANELSANGYEATRMLMPSNDLTELKERRITVVPRSLEAIQLSRQMDQRTYTIDVGVQKHVGDDIEGGTFENVAVAEAIAVLMRSRKLATLPDAVYVSYAIEPFYSPEHLFEMHVATTIVSIRYTL